MAIASSVIVIASVAAYSMVASPSSVPSPQLVSRLTPPAYLLFLVIVAGMAMALLDLTRYSKKNAAALTAGGIVPLAPGSVIPFALSHKRYWRVFAFSTLLYGIVYALLTSVVAYRPDVDFAQYPGLAIPSVQPDQLVGAPLYVPQVTVFLANHVALVLVPLTIVLLVVVSVLVGLNFALSAFAYDNMVKGNLNSLGARLGAIVGLFTGCPTCAGLYFFSLVGGSSAVSFAVALDYYQPLFIFLSIPVLLLSPYLISRSLSKVFRDGCIVVAGDHHLS